MLSNTTADFCYLKIIHILYPQIGHALKNKQENKRMARIQCQNPLNNFYFLVYKKSMLKYLIHSFVNKKTIWNKVIRFCSNNRLYLTNLQNVSNNFTLTNSFAY